MTDERFTEIDQHLVSIGWAYNAESEQFEAIADSSTIEWGNVIVAMPSLSLNELDTFAERKQRDWSRALPD